MVGFTDWPSKVSKADNGSSGWKSPASLAPHIYPNTN